MHLGKVIPILRIFDEAKALGFYVDFLGFKVDWQHRFEANFPLYLQVSLGECVLHLSEHHGDASPGAAVRIQAQGVDAYQQQLVGKGHGVSYSMGTKMRVKVARVDLDERKIDLDLVAPSQPKKQAKSKNRRKRR